MNSEIKDKLVNAASWGCVAAVQIYNRDRLPREPIDCMECPAKGVLCDGEPREIRISTANLAQLVELLEKCAFRELITREK